MFISFDYRCDNVLCAARSIRRERLVKKAKQDLREFVEEGHDSSGWLPGTALSEWWSTREEGKKTIQNALFYGAAAVIGLKLGHWWLTRKQEQQVT